MDGGKGARATGARGLGAQATMTASRGVWATAPNKMTTSKRADQGQAPMGGSGGGLARTRKSGTEYGEAGARPPRER